jgi:endoglucanase
MDTLLKQIIEAAGVSGAEGEIAQIMLRELKKNCDSASVDNFGNVIAKKEKAGKKIMIAAHMDEIGLLVKYINKDGFIGFIKIGGIDDRILPGQRVIIKSKQGDCLGIIGIKPPHLQKDEERKQVIKYNDMFIDIGAKSKEEALKRVSLGDAIIFEPNSGVLNGKLCYGKAIDNRVGCYVLLKIMEKLKAVKSQVYAVATVQEEVGLKGARTAAFNIAPDFAIALDTTMAGDTPQVSERESSLKLGAGVAITIMEAGGRGLIVSEKIREMFISTAKKNKIKYQMDVLEGGMTDGAMIYLNREGVPTGVLAVPTRYVHSTSSVFHQDDLNATVALAVKVIEDYR